MDYKQAQLGRVFVARFDDGETKLGCIKDECNIFLTIEAIIQKLISDNLTKKFNPKYNASLLSFE